MALKITCYGQEITDTIDLPKLTISYGWPLVGISPCPPCTGPGELKIEWADNGERLYYATGVYDEVDRVWRWQSPPLILDLSTQLEPIVIEDITSYPRVKSWFKWGSE